MFAKMKHDDRLSSTIEKRGRSLSRRLYKNGLLVSFFLHGLVLLIITLSTASLPVHKKTDAVRIVLSGSRRGTADQRAEAHGARAKVRPNRKQVIARPPEESIRLKESPPDPVTAPTAPAKASLSETLLRTSSVEGAGESDATSERPSEPDGSGFAGGGGNQGAGQGYDGMILAHIRGRQFYPQIARRNHLEGVVWVDITIRADGALLQSTLSQSSGHGVLDQAALDIVARCDPFPPIPPEVSQISMQYRVPIAFELRHN